MTRVQYYKGMPRAANVIYCARNRDGLTTFSNPFKNDAKGTLFYMSSGKWIPKYVSRPNVIIEVSLFGDRLAPEFDYMTEGSINLFDSFLADPHTEEWGHVCASVRWHMEAMRLAIPALQKDSQLACWCPLDAHCHCDVIIDYYEAYHAKA